MMNHSQKTEFKLQRSKFGLKLFVKPLIELSNSWNRIPGLQYFKVWVCTASYIHVRNLIGDQQISQSLPKFSVAYYLVGWVWHVPLIATGGLILVSILATY